MNNEELKKKICEIIAPYVSAWGEDERIADALIEAGMVDKSDYASMKETAVRYKAEVSKAEARAKEAEHRAEVAERAGRIIQRDMARVFDVSNPRICELIANIWDLAKKQAEKELAEERKDGIKTD